MTIYRFGPFRLEREPLVLALEGQVLPLGPKVVETLLALVERPGEVLAKDQLLEHVWPGGFADEANLAQNVYVLRKIFRTHWGRNPIETVPRRGYRFTAAVQVELPAPPAPTSARPQARRRGKVAFAGAGVFLSLVLAAAIHTVTGSNPAHAAEGSLSTSAARLYSIGRYYWNQRTPDAIAKSERYFEAVVREDGADPQGYAGLASAYAIAADYGYGPEARKANVEQSRRFARKALSVDPSCAEAYAALGLVDSIDGKSTAALSEYRKALALNPADAAAHQWYGTALLLEGRAVEGFDQLQRAADLDPESVAATDWLAQAAFIDRRYKEAVAYGLQALDLSPQRYEVYRTLGMAYQALGEPRSAIEAYETYGKLDPAGRYDAAVLLARAYAASGNLLRAREELGLARRGIALGEVSETNLIAALAAMGEKNEAFHILDARKDREAHALLAIDPRMDPLRNDARFKAYVQHPG